MSKFVNDTEFDWRTWREAAKQLTNQIINDICTTPSTYEDFYSREDQLGGVEEAECRVAEAIKSEMPRFTACGTKALAAALTLRILTGYFGAQVDLNIEKGHDKSY